MILYTTISAQGGPESSLDGFRYPSVSADTVLDIGAIRIADQSDSGFGIRCYRFDLAGSGRCWYCYLKRDRSDPAPPFLIMSALTVKTNNVRRDLISAFELNGAEYSKLRKEFDWMEDQDFDYAMFFNYRGQVYALADFLRTEGDLLAQGWQGVLNQTYFSGLLVKIVDSCQSVVVGRYCS